MIHYLHRGLIRYALALNECRLDPSGFHRAGDGFTAAVHDHRMDLNGRKKNDVAGHRAARRRIGRVHEAATVFDDERRAAEALDVREGFEQRGGFGDKILHERRVMMAERGLSDWPAAARPARASGRRAAAADPPV